jgi:hypothetical protein
MERKVKVLAPQLRGPLSLLVLGAVVVLAGCHSSSSSNERAAFAKEFASPTSRDAKQILLRGLGPRSRVDAHGRPGRLARSHAARAPDR